MRHIDTVAALASICAFGLALYELIAGRAYLPAGICFAIFLAMGIFVLLRRKHRHDADQQAIQTQRSGRNSTNLQAGGDINIGDGGKRGRK